MRQNNKVISLTWRVWLWMKIEPHVAKLTASCVGNWICTVQNKIITVYLLKMVKQDGSTYLFLIYTVFELGMHQFLPAKLLEQWEHKSKEQTPGIIGEYSNKMCLVSYTKYVWELSDGELLVVMSLLGSFHIICLHHSVLEESISHWLSLSVFCFFDSFCLKVWWQCKGLMCVLADL